jgi:hypothetical protein
MVRDSEPQDLRRCVELAAEGLETGAEPFGSGLAGADDTVPAGDHHPAASGDRTRRPEFEPAR